MSDDGFIAGFLCGALVSTLIVLGLVLSIDVSVDWVHTQEEQCTKNEGAKSLDSYHVTCNDGAVFRVKKGTN